MAVRRRPALFARCGGLSGINESNRGTYETCDSALGINHFPTR